MGDQRLELLVGNIASGKSTYCEIEAGCGAIIVNDDSIVNAVHGSIYTLYDEDLKPLYKSTENHIVNMALTMGRRVIIDRPNHTAAMRRRYIGMAHSLDVPVWIVMFKWESPEDHAYRRYQSDSRGIDFKGWTKVAKYHADGYEPPDRQKEHFDHLVYWDFAEKKVVDSWATD